MVLLEPLEAASRGRAAQTIALRLGFEVSRVNRLLLREGGPLTRPLSKIEASRVAGIFKAAGVRVGIVAQGQVAEVSSPHRYSGRHIEVCSEGIEQPMKQESSARSRSTRLRVSEIAREQVLPTSVSTLEREHSDVAALLGTGVVPAPSEPYDLVVAVPKRAELMPAPAVADATELLEGPPLRAVEVVSARGGGWSALLGGGYLAGVIGAGYLSVYVNSLYGMCALVAITTVLLVHAARLQLGHPLRELCTAVAVLPLCYVVPLVLAVVPPWAQLSPPLRLTVTGLTLLLATLVAARALGYGAAELGLGLGRRRLFSPAPGNREGVRRVARSFVAGLCHLGLQGVIALSGIGLVTLSGHFPETLAVFVPDVSGGHITSPLPLAGLIVLFIGGDELLYRGLLQRAAVRALGAGPGLLLSALAFAGSALVIGPPGAALGVALFAGLVGVVVRLSGSLLGVILAQALATSLFLGLLPSPELCFEGGSWLDAACKLQELVMTLQQLLGGL